MVMIPQNTFVVMTFLLPTGPWGPSCPAAVPRELGAGEQVARASGRGEHTTFSPLSCLLATGHVTEHGSHAAWSNKDRVP